MSQTIAEKHQKIVKKRQKNRQKKNKKKQQQLNILKDFILSHEAVHQLAAARVDHN